MQLPPLTSSWSAFALFASAAVVACGGSTDDRADVRPSTGSGGLMQPPGSTGGTGSGGDGSTSTALAPNISLEFDGGVPNLDSPASVTLTGSCRVTAGSDEEGDAIDSSTVELTLLNSDEEVISEQTGAVQSGETDLFVAEFPLATLPSGTYTLSCTASTVGANPNSETATEAIIVDAGPEIALVSPPAESSLKTSSTHRFEFQVTPAELAATDPGADVDTVVVSVKGVDFAAEPVADAPGHYFVVINFADTALFPTQPDGPVLVTVKATNSRGANAVTSTMATAYDLDGAPPVITVDSPTDGAIIGGTVLLTFDATDLGSGVDINSVIVTLNNEPYPYDADSAWTVSGNRFTFEFESESVVGSKVQTNVQISAQDQAGNVAAIASVLYQRDEQPPVISLAPPYFREYREVSNVGYCSHAFYPTGDEATRGGLVDDFVLFRAAIVDDTNVTTGQTVVYYSGTDRSSAELWVKRASLPLIEDTDNDGVCDDIIETDSFLQALTALTPTGNAYYGSGAGDEANPLMTACTYQSSPEPAKLCTDAVSDLSVVAAHPGLKAEPIVYAINPQTGTAVCTGSQWELPSAGLTGYEGWVCAAVRASDKVGNRGVSRPMALCLDNSNIFGAPACALDLDNPPDCADDCTLPPDLAPGGYIYEK